MKIQTLFQRKVSRLPQLAYVACLGAALLLAGCGGGADDSNDDPLNDPVFNGLLSGDQQTFDDIWFNGGMVEVRFNLPVGGGNLVNNVNYAYSVTAESGKVSPLYGTQATSPAIVSMDPALNLPATLNTATLLVGGNMVQWHQQNQINVSYANGDVQFDYLADDGKTVAYSYAQSNFQITTLSGLMSNSPDEVLAMYPINTWINNRNFAANGQWQGHSAYVQFQRNRIGDSYSVENCAQSTATQSGPPAPCGESTLEAHFPVVVGTIGDHVTEQHALSDGSISNINGGRTWTSSAPLPGVGTMAYRTYYELGGKVYQGQLIKDGTLMLAVQADGTVASYQTALNPPAAASISQGLITGSSTSQASVTVPLSEGGVDMFGIGGTGINGSLSAADLAAHYNIPQNATGAGQTIAIVDAPSSGNPSADLDTYSQTNKLPLCNTSNGCFKLVDLSQGQPVNPKNDWASEVALDVQMVHAIAPQANIALFYSASASANDRLAAVAQAASTPGVTAVSMSFAANTPFAPLMDAQFAQLQATYGTVFFASSGDGGNQFNAAQYPAASPYVTAVGGTRVTAVNWSSKDVGWQYSGGGAAAGSLFSAAIPTWQQPALNTVTGFSPGNARLVPDVAAVADFQYSAVEVYYAQRWHMEGGTSASAPIWGGISALLAESMARQGKSLAARVKATPGGFNGMLYQLAQRQGGSTAFYDVVTGANNVQVACTACNAYSGYDEVTGLGEPLVNELMAELT